MTLPYVSGSETRLCVSLPELHGTLPLGVCMPIDGDNRGCTADLTEVARVYVRGTGVTGGSYTALLIPGPPRLFYF